MWTVTAHLYRTRQVMNVDLAVDDVDRDAQLGGDLVDVLSLGNLHGQICAIQFDPSSIHLDFSSFFSMVFGTTVI